MRVRNFLWSVVAAFAVAQANVSLSADQSPGDDRAKPASEQEVQDAPPPPRVDASADRERAEAERHQQLMQKVEEFRRESQREADERYRGGPEKPFTREELHGKFTDCASLVLQPQAIALTLEQLESLENVRNIRDLIGTVTSGLLEGEPVVL